VSDAVRRTGAATQCAAAPHRLPLRPPMGSTADTAGGSGAPAARGPSDLIQSLQRGLRVLEYVAQAPGPVAPKQIAAGTGLKLATAYHLINTLLHEGYLRRECGQGLVLGENAAGAPRASTELDHPQFVPIRRALGQAAYAVSDVVLMTVLDGAEAVVVASEEVPGAPNRGRYGVGTRHLPHASAAGRAMLATQEPRHAGRLLEQCSALAASWGAEFDEARVNAELERVRRCGVSLAQTPLDACIGAPVSDRHGRPVGAVAVVISPGRLRKESARFAEIARSTAESISRTVTRLELAGQLDDRLRGLTRPTAFRSI
jgi:DNA-binding IclR family transcriptional regulator